MGCFFTQPQVKTGPRSKGQPPVPGYVQGAGTAANLLNMRKTLWAWAVSSLVDYPKGWWRALGDV